MSTVFVVATLPKPYLFVMAGKLIPLMKSARLLCGQITRSTIEYCCHAVSFLKSQEILLQPTRPKTKVQKCSTAILCQNKIDLSVRNSVLNLYSVLSLGQRLVSDRLQKEFPNESL